MSGPLVPPGTGPLMPRDPTPINAHLGHVSNHFMRGTFDTPLTQKFNHGNTQFRVDTPVDRFGNVGPSSFG
jgi:hypothetical protein